ncbi:MAG: transporter, family, fosmidomycin resistance protein [Acidobacteriota bacterium]|jgi:FSR family fosmidomycin resistance protein-like MFS transporter|nr:transporter, family, fosmidomycin resistance protein [Acidobacteriota bacterium]
MEWCARFDKAAAHEQTRAALLEGLRGALHALRRRAVLRWLVLLQLGDFTYDILRGFLALYFVDVVGAGSAGAALAVAVWTCVGLAGSLFPVALGAYAEHYGLGSMMWLLALGPAALLTGLLMVKEKE